MARSLAKGFMPRASLLRHGQQTWHNSLCQYARITPQQDGHDREDGQYAGRQPGGSTGNRKLRRSKPGAMNGTRVAQQVEPRDDEQGADQCQPAQLRCGTINPPVTDKTEARRDTNEAQRANDERRARQRQSRAQPARVEGDGASDPGLGQSDSAEQDDFRQGVTERTDPGTGQARRSAGDQPQKQKA